MHQLDFDGDTCEVVCNDTPEGKLIVDGVRDIEYTVHEAGADAKFVKFSIENLIDHLVTSAKVSRVGIITNYASRALDVANHLKAAIHFAKTKGCEKLYFAHPSAFGKGLGYNAKPEVIPNKDGERFFKLKGFVGATFTKEGKAKFNANGKNIATVTP